MTLLNLWRRWIREPFTWLFLSIFQPTHFQNRIAPETARKRLTVAPRLLLPMFLCTYPIALLIRIGLYRTFPLQLENYFIHGPPHIELDIVAFWFDTTWATAASCIIAGLFGSIFGLEYGIAFGLAGGIADGLSINLSSDTLVMINFGLATGLMLGLTFNRLRRMRYQGSKAVEVYLGIASGLTIGIVAGIFCGFWAGTFVRLAGYRLSIPDIIDGTGAEGNAAGITAGAIAACLVAKTIGTIAEGNSRSRQDMLHDATSIAIAVAGVTAASVAVVTGDDAMHNVELQNIIISRGIYGIAVSGIFLAAYIPGYYRLPLYPVSALSLLRAYVNSCKNPARVFHYLRRSSLHWDECVFLPLPKLKPTLLIAAGQNANETLNEIDFLLHERRQQGRAARDVALKIVLEDLMLRESLRAISHAQQRLALAPLDEIRRTDPHVARIFHRLESVSQDAVHYYSRISWQEGYDILEHMPGDLRKTFSGHAFKDKSLNHQLEEVLQNWQAAIRYEQERISRDRHVEQIGRIENPYVPGMVLEPDDPLFVGRRELAQRLSEALRQDQRPTFFLTGERRMGKSSILKQLPQLLGSRYLPIFYDMQSTGIAASVAALLAAIAEEVYATLLARGMLVRELTYDQLKNDLRENEAVAYHHFSRWLKEVEHVLAQEERILLLTFDEFEKFAVAEQKGYLDLSLLFGWFRSLIQHHPHLTLLFSGVKSIGDMGTRWSGYFVNVESLQVSFLRPEEGRQLIMHPVPTFPGERIFGEEVAREIMRVTGCHPFLIQALCSILISQFNDSSRRQATFNDVNIALKEVLKKWKDNYFSDLWDRTDEGQRTCLRIIHTLGAASSRQIQQQSSLDETMISSSLRKLLKRDLLQHNDGAYQIVAPIFSLWVDQNI